MTNGEQKLVSVIVAAYNAEKYIIQALESVIGQTYKNLEIIVVDDGSTDGTVQVVEEYIKKDARIVLRSQTNKGPSAARNAGFKIAKGAYFCIFDADDIMMPTKIEAQVTFMESHPLADVVYSKVYYFIDGTNTIYTHDLCCVSGAAVYQKLLQYGNFIYTSTVFFKRNVFDRLGGFDENLRSAEEWDYWLTLSREGVTFLHQDEYLLLCRSRENGLTSDSVTMYTTAVAVLEKHMTNASHPFWSKMTSRQYIKSSFLLTFSKARKAQPKSMSGDSAKNTTSRNGGIINRLFVFLRKVKFSLTFKKVQDAELVQYLGMIESHRNYETNR